MLFETKVFKKLFLTYSLVIIISLSILSIFVMNKITKNIKDQQLYVNRKIIYDANEYINNQIDSTKVLFYRLYARNQELEDTIYYLNNDFEDYIKFRLDKFLSSDKVFYSGMDLFVKEWYDYNTNIEDIGVYSYKNDVLSLFDKNGDMNRVPIDKNKNDLNETENIDEEILDIIDRKNNKNKRKNFYAISYIRNPHTLDNIGFFIVTYKTNELENILKKYDAVDNKLMLLTSTGNVIYDSSQKYEGEFYPYFNSIVSGGKSKIRDEESYIDYVLNPSEMLVLSAVPEKTIFDKTRVPLVTINIFTIIIILIAEAAVYFKIRKLGRRTHNIIHAMDNLKEGNFNISIPIGNEDDELNLIAESFNNTCKTLDGYIKKVYLAEIKQKKSEMDALQTQINPHFLYNTLESIRMKAVVNGDKEVGKMLYNLAALFRNMVKGENVITIRQELDYCKMYLELYKFRYDDKFEYCIDSDNEVLNKRIIKFIIQPAIENYLVHGIDLEREDNFLMITAEKQGTDIVICIEDNGKGINKDVLHKINSSLHRCVKYGDSIGLLNTHERIVLTYGEGYGVTLMKGYNNGTKLMIKIPATEVNTNV